MQTVVQKWGNSLGIRIPAMYVREFDLKNGSPVGILEADGQLVIKPRQETLEQALARITDDNRHESVTTGQPVGKETW